MRTNLATTVALVGAALLALTRDPALHAGAVVLVMLLWGAAVAVLAPDDPRPVRIVVTALAVRALLWLPAATLSDDVWRYVWEGHVWRAGRSPFTYAPDAPELAFLRDDTWARVGHREVSSIYPPLAQALFVVLPSVPAWRFAAALADVGTAALLARRSPGAGWAWALLPLPAVESAVSGHLEAFGVLALVAALGGRPWAAWVGAMIKLLPGVLLVRRGGWRWIVPTVLVVLPLAGPGLLRGFQTYRAHWVFNGGVFPVVAALVGDATARTVLQAVGVAVVVGILLRSRDPGRIALWTTGAFVLLSPTVHPWYALWPLAAGLWTNTRGWTLLAVLVPLSYLVLVHYDGTAATWHDDPGVRLAEWLPVHVTLAVGAWRRLTRASPAPVW